MSAPAPPTCSPQLANLPDFEVPDIKPPTGTAGRMPKAQALAVWREFNKSVRSANSLAYTRFLANCEVEELADHLAHLLANGFFFTQAPFMAALKSRFNIENELIANLPSIQTVMRMLKGDTIDVTTLSSEISDSKMFLREQITTRTFVLIYHFIREMDEWEVNQSVMTYNRKLHAFIENNALLARAMYNRGLFETSPTPVTLASATSSAPSGVQGSGASNPGGGCAGSLNPAPPITPAPGSVNPPPVPPLRSAPLPPCSGGALGSGPVPSLPPPAPSGGGSLPGATPSSAFNAGDAANLRGELQEVHEDVADFKRDVMAEIVRLRQLQTPSRPTPGASNEALEAMTAACASQARTIAQLERPIDHHVSRYPTTPPDEAWMADSDVIGLQDAPRPNLSRAWASRPSPNLSPAQEKEALRQLGSLHSAESLLKCLPAPGQAELYREGRCVFIEGVYIFKHIVCTVADKDGYTLGSLQTCALTLAREDSTNSHRWKSLAQAVSVGEFIKKVDALYILPSDNAVEQEWGRATKNATSPLDLLHRLRPVMVNDPKRAKMLILQYLGGYGAEAFSVITAIQQSHSPDAWEATLASFEEMQGYISEAKKTKKTSSKEQGLNVFERLDGSAPRHDGTDIPKSWGSFDTQIDLNPNEIKVMTDVLHAFRAAEKGGGSSSTGDLPPSVLQSIVGELRRQLPNELITGGVPAMANGAGELSSSSKRLAALEQEVADKARLAALEQQLAAYSKNSTFKPIYDLTKVYPLLGFAKSDVPEAKPGAAAGGGKCKLCSMLGFTEFVNYNEVSFKDLKDNQRYDHNPWKCPNVHAAVKKKAMEDPSITPELIREALVPLPVQPWK